LLGKSVRWLLDFGHGALRLHEVLVTRW
jgi:hypothetical protein